MSEPRLSDACWVIRGGVMSALALRRSVETCHARLGFFGLSFWGEDEMTVKEICFVARLRNRRIRVSTMGRLRSRGYEPVRSGHRPHLKLEFSQLPSEEELWRLAHAFDADISNPGPRD